METRNLTCIGCPMGCAITVTLDAGEVQSVTGNTCAIGDRYARQEVTKPERMVTSTVRLTGGAHGRLSVKTKTAVPKTKIFAVMEEINRASVKAPVSIGDVVIENVCGLGIDVVATKAAKAV